MEDDVRAFLCFIELCFMEETCTTLFRKHNSVSLREWDIRRVSVMPQFFASPIFRQVSHLKTIEYLCEPHFLISIFTSVSDVHGKTAWEDCILLL